MLINRYISILVTVAGCFIFWSCDRKQPPPNIVIIYADDLGYGDVSSYYPESKIPTLNIDRLGREGISFFDAHSAASVCTPSRYALLTGKYPFRSRLPNGVLWSYDRPLIDDEKEQTLPAFLQTKGYHTAIIGKWHLGFDWPVDPPVAPEVWDTLDDRTIESMVDFNRPLGGGPNSLGFDYFFGMDTPNFPPYAFLENGRIVGEQPVRVDSFKLPGGVPGLQQRDWDIYRILPELRNRTIGYLEDRAKTEQSFFLFLSLTAPHTPIAPLESFAGKSGAGDYGDFVVQVDDLVGEVVKRIDDLGIRENTIIIFTSDNGSPMHARQDDFVGTIIGEYGHNPSGNWRGMKGDSWEGGHRVPFIVSWKGKTAEGGQSDQLVCQTDLMATVYDLLDEPVPDPVKTDSYSLMPLILGEDAATERNSIVHQSSKGELSIRENEWKLILGKGSGGITAWIDPDDGKGNPYPGQLYNMKSDPGETNNLYGDEAYALKIKNLTQLLESLKSHGPNWTRR